MATTTTTFTHRRTVLLRACIAATIVIPLRPARAETATWLSPTSGTWSDPANWSTNPTYPNDPATDALLAAAGSTYTLTLNSPVSLHSLTGTSPDASLKLTAGGTLTLSSSLSMGPGSLSLAGGKVIGGTLASPLVVSQAAHVTLDSTTLASTLTVSRLGNVTAAGSFSLDNATIHFPDTGTLYPTSGLLTGTGTILFDSAAAAGNHIITPASTLTIGSGITIRTGPNLTALLGKIGTGGPLVNHGLISSRTPGVAIAIETSALTNTGTIEARDGGLLRLRGSYTVPHLDTISTPTGGAAFIAGGTLTATGSTLTLSSSHNIGVGDVGTIAGGAVSAADGTPLTIYRYSDTGAARLLNVSVFAPVSLNPNSSLTATNSTFSSLVSSNSARLTLSGTYSLTGGLALANASAATFAGTLAGTSGPISATESTLTLTTPLNLAGAPTVTLSPSAALNIGAGGTLTASLSNAAVTGGGTVRILTAAFPALSNVTLAGATSLVVDASNASLRDGLTMNGGRFTLTSSKALVQSLAGSGEIVFDYPSGGTVEINGAGSTLPAGFIARNGNGPGWIICTTMAGTISAQVKFKQITLDADAVTGTVEARNGGTVELSTFAQVRTPDPATGGSSLNGPGSWTVYDGSTIHFPGSLTHNATNITLSGPTANFIGLPSLIRNSGSLTLTAGKRLALSSASLTNSGIITIGPNSALQANGTLDNSGTISLAHATSCLLLNYSGPSPADTLRAQLLAGHFSSPDPASAIAYAEASTLLNLTGAATTLYLGQTVDSTALIIKPTTPGDANLDGQIDSDDYTLLDRSLAVSRTNPHWTDGDFNYDGIITNQDYLLIDTAFYQAHGFSPGFLSQRESQFGSNYVSQLLTSIPEPSLPLLTSAFCLLTSPPRSIRRRVPTRVI